MGDFLGGAPRRAQSRGGLLVTPRTHEVQKMSAAVCACGGKYHIIMCAWFSADGMLRHRVEMLPDIDFQ